MRLSAFARVPLRAFTLNLLAGLGGILGAIAMIFATEALPHLKARGGALIVTGSIASDMPSPVLSAYTASKHAVKGYVDSLRLELMHEKAPVSVSLIQPSGINTPFVDKALNQMNARAMIPPPIYSPDLVAEAILHAAQTPTRDMIVGGRKIRPLSRLAVGFLIAAGRMMAGFDGTHSLGGRSRYGIRQSPS